MGPAQNAPSPLEISFRVDLTTEIVGRREAHPLLKNPLI
jgi:hypothetical protein